MRKFLQRIFAAFLVFSVIFSGHVVAQDRQDLFESDKLAELAWDYRAALISEVGQDQTPTPLLMLQSTRAADNQQWSVLRDNLEKLAARNPDSPATWLRLARAWRAANASNLRAAAAGYRAYDIATTQTQQADALFVLGDIMFEVWRRSAKEDPVNATSWRTVSKLIFAQIGRSVADTNRITDKIATMDKTGLTVLTEYFYAGIGFDKRVGDAPAPLCVRFSDPIEKQVDKVLPFLDLVAVGLGQDAVSDVQWRISGDELCALRLRWGAEYVLTIKEGFPAASGISLAAPFSMDGRMPDATPSLGFDMSEYVLARGGHGQVTLSAINFATADLKVYRMPDRNFLRALAVDGFDVRVTPGNFDAMIGNHAEQIWERRLDLQDRPNTQQILKLPAGDLIDTWEAAARAGGGIPPKDLYEGAFDLDISRPDARGTLGPAAYAVVIDQAKTPQELRLGPTGAGVPYNPTLGRSAVKWVVRSDLGLSLIKGARDVHVAVRHLSDGMPVVGATVELLAKGGRVLGVATADANGIATFERRLTRGVKTNAFRAVVAYAADDFGILMSDEVPLNLSELDISGRQPPELIDVMAISERQIYRPGEKVEVLILARDANGQALDTLPALDVTVVSDSGIVAGRTRLEPDDVAWQNNGRLAAFKLVETAPIGPAHLEISIPGVERPLSKTPIQVQFFRPDRAAMTLDADWNAALTDGTVTVAGAAIGEYLFGGGDTAVAAPVKNAPVEAWFDLVEVASPIANCYADYGFGDDDETPQKVRRKVDTLARTDAMGRVALSAEIAHIASSSRPRAVVPSLYLLEETGVIARYEGEEEIILRQERDWIGIRQSEGNNPALSGTLAFDIVSLSADNAARETRVSMRIVRERTTYVWSGEGIGWDYQPSVQTTQFASRVVALSATRADANGCLSPTTVQFNASEGEPLPLGNYRVEILDNKGAVLTAKRFRVGAQSDASGSEKPQLFPVRVSQDQISGGETMTIAATDLPFATGRVLLGLSFKGQMVNWLDAQITDGRAETVFSIPEDWEGRYIHVFAKAFGQSEASSGSIARAVGLSGFHVAAQQRQLDVTVSALPDVGSNDATTVTVNVANAMADEDTYMVLFAVDEGIHRITGYEAPDPFNFFHGHQGFGFEIQDLYARLIRDEDAQMLGENGGDLFSDFRNAGYTSKQLAVQVAGPMPIREGKATVDLKSFGFTGQVRLDAFAWTKDRAGHGQGSLRVFDTLELSVVAPRSVSAGDRMVIPATLRNISQASTDRFRIIASVDGAELGDGLLFIEEEVTLPEGHAARVPVPIVVPESASGPIKLSVSVEDLGGILVEQLTDEQTITIRKSELPRTKIVKLDQLAAGESSVLVDRELRERLGRVSRFDAASVQYFAQAVGQMPRVAAIRSELLNTADNSRDFRSLASAGVMRLALSVDEAKTQDILALQTDEGGFMPVPIQTRIPVLAPGQDQNTKVLLEPLWRSAVALDFLQYSQRSGRETSAQSLNSAKGFLSTYLRRYVESSSDSPDEICRREVFFAGLVLARADAIDRGSFERIKRFCESYGMGQFETALLSSFMLAYGDVTAGNELMALTLDVPAPELVGEDKLQQMAMSIALLAEDQADRKNLDGLLVQVAAGSVGLDDLGPDAAAWILRAQDSLKQVIGAPKEVELGILPETFTDTDVSKDGVWASKQLSLSEPVPDIQVANFGDVPLDLFAMVRLPQSALIADPESTMTVRRRIFATNGSELIDTDDFDLAQNELAIFVVEGRVPDDLAGKEVRVAVPIPAGFDIDVSRMTQETTQGILGRDFELYGRPLFIEAMPDQLLLVIDPGSLVEEKIGQRFSYAFAARAVVEGRFSVPVTVAEVIDHPAMRGDSTLLQINVSAAR